ncbi:MAG: gamma-glutamyltransferase [Dermatophilaceae bacterium]
MKSTRPGHGSGRATAPPRDIRTGGIPRLLTVRLLAAEAVAGCRRMGPVALAATGPASVAAGAEVARSGGNAVDTAVAAALAAMATEPGIVSLGGGAFINIWPAVDEPVVVDGNVEMPGRGLGPDAFGRGVRRVFTEYGGGVTMDVGHGSVATPGAVAACHYAVSRWGAMSWADVVAPSARACHTGYPVGGAAAQYLRQVAGPVFGADPEARHVVTRADGSPLRRGDICTNPALGDVLDLVGRDGASVLTTGEVGAALAADMARHGGLVTSSDLAAYTPVVRMPVRRRLGVWDLAFTPPPAIGGPVLAVLLGELARRGRWGWRDVLDVQLAVLRYRHDVHDVAADLEAAGRALLHTTERHGLAGLTGLTGLTGSASTIHISAVDDDGVACAVTTSSGYGSGVVIPGTGLLLNNALGEHELNRTGLHRLRPGTRLASNMAPTTGRAGDGQVLAVGSPGADRITTALMQVLGAMCLHGVDLPGAIDAPRLHVRVAGDVMVAEHEADPDIAVALVDSGIRRNEHPGRSMYFGGVGAAYRGEDGRLEVAGDSRREAAVAVV